MHELIVILLRSELLINANHSIQAVCEICIETLKAYFNSIFVNFSFGFNNIDFVLDYMDILKTYYRSVLT